MRCLKCGTTNPDSARFCFECGTTLQEPLKTGFLTDTTKFCPKCSASNPKDGRFCFECGNPLEDTSQPQPRQCPSCGISIDTSRLFCPNCGQSFIEKPLEVNKEQISVPLSLSRNLPQEKPALHLSNAEGRMDRSPECLLETVQNIPKAQLSLKVSPLNYSWYSFELSASLKANVLRPFLLYLNNSLKLYLTISKKQNFHKMSP